MILGAYEIPSTGVNGKEEGKPSGVGADLKLPIL